MFGFLSCTTLDQDSITHFTAFLTAAGFSSASVLFKLRDPQFVFNDYTVAPFQVSASPVTRKLSRADWCLSRRLDCLGMEP
jgi:hypothetical protein